MWMCFVCGHPAAVTTIYYVFIFFGKNGKKVLTKIVTEQIDSFDQLLSVCHLFVGLKASKVDVNVGEGKNIAQLR